MPLFSHSPRRSRKALVNRPEVDVPITTSLLAVFAFAGALVAAFFLKSSRFVFDNIFLPLLEKGPAAFAVGSFLVITLAAVAVGLLLGRIRPQASGSGIPQLKVAFHGHSGRIPVVDILVKFVAGVLSLGGGFSLGNEGPTIFSAGATSSACAGAFGLTDRKRKAACAAGAAAGLASAFNAPLASVTFVIEEIAEGIFGRHLGGLLMAGVIGAGTSWLLVGRHPAYILQTLTDVRLHNESYFLIPFAALFAAVVGIWFQHRVLRWRQLVRGFRRIPAWCRPVLGAWLVWVAGIAVWAATGHIGVFSLGYADLASALRGDIAWHVALLLLLGKLVATTMAFSWGGMGGVFAPSLFFGAMAGAAVAGFARTLGLDIGPQGMTVLALVGMSACFGTVDRAPLTAILIVFEMTGRYEILPFLMIGTVVSQAYAYYFSEKLNLYDSIIRQDAVAAAEAAGLYGPSGK